MDNQAVIERIVKNLAFEVKAIPKNEETGSSSPVTTSKSTPINVKIRVKKEFIPDKYHGVTSIPKFDQKSVKNKINRVNSDQTILSFDVSIEKQHRKPVKKSRRYIIDMLKPGLCLGASEDEQYQYLPSTSNNTKINEDFKSREPVPQKFTLSKNALNDDYSLIKRHNGILGNSKPGGCLDPSYGEDKYSYEPNQQNNCKNAEGIGNLHDPGSKRYSIFGSDIFKKSKKSIARLAHTSDQNTETGTETSKLSLQRVESTAETLSVTQSNLVITYPPIFMPINKPIKDNKHSRKSSENKSEKSINIYNNSYYTPQYNKAQKKESGLADDTENAPSQNIPLNFSTPELGLERITMTAEDKENLITVRAPLKFSDQMAEIEKDTEKNRATPHEEVVAIHEHVIKSPSGYMDAKFLDQISTIVNTDNNTIMTDKEVIFIHDHKIKTPSQNISITLLKTDEDTSNFTADITSAEASTDDFYNNAEFKSYEKVKTEKTDNALTADITKLKDNLANNLEKRVLSDLQQSLISIKTTDTFSQEKISARDNKLQVLIPRDRPLKTNFENISNQDVFKDIITKNGSKYTSELGKDENKLSVIDPQDAIDETGNTPTIYKKGSNEYLAPKSNNIEENRSIQSQNYYKLGEVDTSILEQMKALEIYKDTNTVSIRTLNTAPDFVELGSKDSLPYAHKDNNIQHEAVTLKIPHYQSNKSLELFFPDLSEFSEKNEADTKSITTKISGKSSAESKPADTFVFDDDRQTTLRAASKHSLSFTDLQTVLRTQQEDEENIFDGIFVQNLPENVATEGITASIKAEFNEKSLSTISGTPKSEKDLKVDVEHTLSDSVTEYKNKDDNYPAPQSQSHKVLSADDKKILQVQPETELIKTRSSFVAEDVLENNINQLNEYFTTDVGKLTRKSDSTSSLIKTMVAADDSIRQINLDSISKTGIINESQIIVEEKLTDHNSLRESTDPKIVHSKTDPYSKFDPKIKTGTNNMYERSTINVDVNESILEATYYQRNPNSKSSSQIDSEIDNISQGAIKSALRTGVSDVGLKFDSSNKSSRSIVKPDDVRATLSDKDEHAHTNVNDIMTISKSRSTYKKSLTGSTKNYEGSISVPSTLESPQNSDMINLDLGIQTFVNDEKERVLKTFDSTQEPMRYRHDTITVVQSQIKLTTNEIRFPIDTQHDLLMQIQKIKENQDENVGITDVAPGSNKVSLKRNELFGGNGTKLQRNSNLKFHHRQLSSDEAHTSLADIYNHELVPLYVIIRTIKKEIDVLAKQQTLFKEKVYGQRKIGRASRMLQSNKRCGCLKRLK